MTQQDCADAGCPGATGNAFNCAKVKGCPAKEKELQDKKIETLVEKLMQVKPTDVFQCPACGEGHILMDCPYEDFPCGPEPVIPEA